MNWAGSHRGALREAPHAFSPDEFSWHHKLLERKLRLLNPAQGKFRQVRAQFFRKLSNRRQSGVQNVTHSVIETGNADVVGNSYS